MSVQSQIDRLNAIKARIRTNLVAQGITVPADTMLDAMAEQILSVAGQRGTGLLPVTTAPSGYTTAVGGITPKYRMAISTIKTQAGVTEVLLGDTIRYSYYHYPIAYLDASYAYFTTRVSIRGATGDDGKTAYQYAVDGGYEGTEEEFAAKLAAETVYVGAEKPTDKSVKLWFNPDGAPSTTVQTDWNQLDSVAPDFLKNKPFGDFTGDTLTWTIDFTKIDIENLPGGYFVKVSDTIITMSDLSNGCVFDLFGEPFPVAPEEIIDTGKGIVALPELFAIFVDESGVGVETEGLIFPESGTYVIIEFTNGYLTIPGFAEFISTKKMDSKYLPDAVAEKTVLFYDPQYLYKDAIRTEKILYAELANLVSNHQIVVLSDLSSLCTPVYIGATETYGYVVCFAKDAYGDVKLTTIYTAEYTPE